MIQIISRIQIIPVQQGWDWGAGRLRHDHEVECERVEDTEQGRGGSEWGAGGSAGGWACGEEAGREAGGGDAGEGGAEQEGEGGGAAGGLGELAAVLWVLLLGRGLPGHALHCAHVPGRSGYDGNVLLLSSE